MWRETKVEEDRLQSDSGECAKKRREDEVGSGALDPSERDQSSLQINCSVRTAEMKSKVIRT